MVGLAIGGGVDGFVALLADEDEYVRLFETLGAVGIVFAVLAVVWWLGRCACDPCHDGSNGRRRTYPRVSEPRTESSPPPRPPQPVVDPGFQERLARADHLHAGGLREHDRDRHDDDRHDHGRHDDDHGHDDHDSDG